MYRLSRTLLTTMVLTATTAPVWAIDARSTALGGSVIANGQGVHGALENPATLMAMKRAGQRGHFRLGGGLELRDGSGSISTFREDGNENLISDIEREIDELSQRSINCNPITDTQDAECLDDTAELADLASRVLDILNDIDGQSLDGQLSVDAGGAFTTPTFPWAVHYTGRGTGAARPEVSASDIAYIEEFETLLADDSLQLGEASNSSFLQVNAFGLPLGVTQPEDILQSSADSSALLRHQFAISLASTVQVAGLAVDVGVTPKVSQLTAYNVTASFRDEFDSNTADLADRFEDSEKSGSSFTFDVGGSLALTQFPMRVAAVLRNVVPESITTEDGFEFETTPQLVVGGVFQQGMLSINTDIALNEAKLDNFETQILAIGIEFGNKLFAIRGGISHDNARDNDATALSLGFGLGPLQFGTRVTDTDELQASAQLSFSFQ